MGLMLKTIKDNGVKTYKLINSINQMTRANLGLFANYNIERYFLHLMNLI